MGRHRATQEPETQRSGAGSGEERSTPEGLLLGFVVLFGWYFLLLTTGGVWAWVVLIGGIVLLFVWGALERKYKPRLALRRRARNVARLRAGRSVDYVSPPRKVLRVLAQAVLLVLAVVLGVVFYGTMAALPSLLFIAAFGFGAWGLVPGVPLGVLVVWAWVRYVPARGAAAAGLGAAAGVGIASGFGS